MVHILKTTKVFNYPCISHVNCYPLSVKLSRGTYLIQCFGASGGDSTLGKGGFGAFVSGITKLNETKTFFLFIGAEGHLEHQQTTYNGGGRSSLKLRDEGRAASGGGSTDIRLINSSNTDGLLSRIIVAGGGGGAESFADGIDGGDAGSFLGESGNVKSFPVDGYSLSIPTGGNQKSGGDGCSCLTSLNGCLESYDARNGIFGFGGNGSNDLYGGGGGGGYFGGGGGCVTHNKVTSGAGGSSYISGHEKCSSYIKNQDGSLQESNLNIHSSGLFFTSITFLNGTVSKHKGNGKILITLLEFYKTLNSFHYLKINLFLFVIVSVGNDRYR